jgi:hypothetical protein
VRLTLTPAEVEDAILAWVKNRGLTPKTGVGFETDCVWDGRLTSAYLEIEDPPPPHSAYRDPAKT